MQTDLPIASVRFTTETVSLFFVPEGEEVRARHLVMRLPRDNSKGEDDPNVLYLRRIEKTANEARETVDA